ncbi:MAG: hypothetical protein LBH11_06490 [Propionibacteriaceae bacterium]|jgi:CobQ-like glutamine amidotransferase family enzyme|nr:hypothetical protein [Propionibacteriaceae bacterium]
MIIEQLFPEVANLYGDSFNVRLLALSRPAATVIETKLGDTPAFALRDDIDLVYLGSMTENGQRQVMGALAPYRERLVALAQAGKRFLFTGNALDLVGERVTNPDMGYEFAGLGLFPFTTMLRMYQRINDKVLCVGDGEPVVGFKSTFSHRTPLATAASANWSWAKVVRGLGLATGLDEGARLGGLTASDILGPLLPLNPPYAKALLADLGAGDAPLVHEQALTRAYGARLAEFRDPRCWESGGH